MTCRKAAQFIDDFVDGSLDELLQSDILEHTEKCSKCRAKFNETSSLKGMLGRFSTTLPDENYFEQLTNSILSRLNDNPKTVTRIH